MWICCNNNKKEIQPPTTTTTTVVKSKNAEKDKLIPPSSPKNGSDNVPSPRHEIVGNNNNHTHSEPNSARDREQSLAQFKDCIISSDLNFLTIGVLPKVLSYSDCENAVKEKDEESYKNTVTEPPAEIFMVRGINYFNSTGKNQKHLKVPSEPCPYQMCGFNMLRSDEKLTHYSQQIGPLRR